MNTIDGTGSFLHTDVRHDLADDFRSTSMRWNPDMILTLPAEEQAELERQEEYVAITRKINHLNLKIGDEFATEEERERFKAERSQVYAQRKKLQDKKLRELQQTQPLEYPTERELHEQAIWQQTHFNRIYHTMPERHRLAHLLFLRVPIRSPEGMEALRYLVDLRTNDCNVAYQDVLRPINGRCPVPSCQQEMIRLVRRK